MIGGLGVLFCFFQTPEIVSIIKNLKHQYCVLCCVQRSHSSVLAPWQTPKYWMHAENQHWEVPVYICICQILQGMHIQKSASPYFLHSCRIVRTGGGLKKSIVHFPSNVLTRQVSGTGEEGERKELTLFCSFWQCLFAVHSMWPIFNRPTIYRINGGTYRVI